MAWFVRKDWHCYSLDFDLNIWFFMGPRNYHDCWEWAPGSGGHFFINETDLIWEDFKRLNAISGLDALSFVYPLPKPINNQFAHINGKQVTSTQRTSERKWKDFVDNTTVYYSPVTWHLTWYKWLAMFLFC